MSRLRSQFWLYTLLVTLLLAGIITPFIIWGESFEKSFSLEGSQAWLTGWGSWAWAAGVLLLVSDIVLPIPGTVVMSALGWLYGWWVGGMLAAGGSFLSGLVAYLLCRWLGRPAALWIAGEDGMRRGELFFQRRGVWLVAISRWAPVLPEAIACLAGLLRMPLRPFALALACGSLPLGFCFAAIGHLGHGSPALALTLSAIIPFFFVILASRNRRSSKDSET